MPPEWLISLTVIPHSECHWLALAQCWPVLANIDPASARCYDQSLPIKFYCSMPQDSCPTALWIIPLFWNDYEYSLTACSQFGERHIVSPIDRIVWRYQYSLGMKPPCHRTHTLSTTFFPWHLTLKTQLCDSNELDLPRKLEVLSIWFGEIRVHLEAWYRSKVV